MKRLQRLEQKEIKKALRTSLRKSAKEALNLARQAAPVETGALKRTMKVRALKRSRVRLGVTVQTGSRKDLAIARGRGPRRSLAGRGYYPAWQEYQGPKAGFMRNAHKQASKRTVRLVTSAIIQSIRAASKR